MSTSATSPVADRPSQIVARLKEVFEDVSGLELAHADAAARFVELGLDSLSLTQIALQMKKVFKVEVTFRQMMEGLRSFDTLAAYLDRQLPTDAASTVDAAMGPESTEPVNHPLAALISAGSMAPLASQPGASAISATAASHDLLQQVIQQQMQLMARQLALLGGGASSLPATPIGAAPEVGLRAPLPAVTLAEGAKTDDSTPSAMAAYDVKKAFGAIARIHTTRGESITERQQARLDAFIRRYIAKTAESKAYTQFHRAHLADPRVVNGFRPQLKEVIYQIVVERSRGARLWDIDGNEYVDVLSGFGMDMFGWSPSFVQDAVRRQLDAGYEIGPQHPLAGEVAALVCELTGFDRAGLCNTGSEAVMGTLRIARTVTGRSLVVIFTGSYHGIFDEVIVRGTKKLRSVPAAPGIMPSTAQNVLVLDYGTEESLRILRERAHELAAILVEPVQSRRPDFRPVEFLRDLRTLCDDSGALLIFDEVVTGFRAHPRGVQGLFDIQADLGAYGKVVGGGFSIGVIAGKRAYMDALDGGHWDYGDDSVPTVGVTYFAGTFVRHPLALAATKATLAHLQAQGPELQAALTARLSEVLVR